MSARAYRVARFALAPGLAAAAVLVLGALLALAPAATAAPLRQHPAPTPLPDYGQTTCAITTTTRVQPETILLGENLTVTRHARAVCAERPQPLHVVLVLDGSASMAGRPNAELERVMRDFVADVEGDLTPDTRMAVVTFDARGRELCALTDRFDRVRRCIRQLRAAGDATIKDGLEAARRTLIAGRGLWPTLPEGHIREMVVLVSGGSEASRCEDARSQAGILKGLGILIATVCVGPDCDVRCMAHLASSPRYAFEARSLARLRDIFRQIRTSVSDIVLRALTFTETLPADVALVDGSPSPPATVLGGKPTRLVWTTRYVPSTGFTVTYRARPLAPGYRPLSAGAEGAFADNFGLTGRFAFDVPWARVLGSLASDGP